MRVAAMRAGLRRSWILVAVIALYASAGGGCAIQGSKGTGSRVPTSAQVITARTYRAEVSMVCERYNTEIMQIGRKARGSREHEVELARVTNAATTSEARALMQIPRPSGFGRFESLYRAMKSAAAAGNESAKLFSVGQLGKADAASLGADHELRVINRAFRLLGLPICAE